jgi:ribosomal protein S18 acetylase RimI-like enzyme
MAAQVTSSNRTSGPQGAQLSEFGHASSLRTAISATDFSILYFALVYPRFENSIGRGRLRLRGRICGMIIRRAGLEDAWGIATIHVQAWRVAYRGIVPDEYLGALSIEQRHAGWRQILEAGESVWVAEDGNEVLGWISAARSRDVDASQSTGEIWAVYVDPGHWRTGVGRALCAAAEQELRRQGFTEMTLWALKDNELARRFYASIGFVRDACEDRIIQLGGKGLHEVRMRKYFIR